MVGWEGKSGAVAWEGKSDVAWEGMSGVGGDE